MRFVDAHQDAFRQHGFCAAGADPPFDTACFRDGGSFRAVGSGGPVLTCGERPSTFAPYASRARWVRTPNDAYFSAMTYPRNLSQGWTALFGAPEDLHDALWGLTAALYSGAIHPTAEGHAAMADATLPVVREALGLPPTPAP